MPQPSPEPPVSRRLRLMRRRITAATLATFVDLKKLGVRLAIDDFGTGYSSLSYLHRFPIDILKIDRSFVASMFNGPDQTALVRSILTLSETLHLETVAEGIEEAGQLAELRSCGATMGQGYFFSRPVTSDAVTTLLVTGGGYIAGSSVRGDVALGQASLFEPTSRARSGSPAMSPARRAGESALPDRRGLRPRRGSGATEKVASTR